MDSVKKILFFAVGLIMTVGFIAIGMQLFNKSKDMITGTTEEYDNIVGNYEDTKYDLFDGEDAVVSGSEIIKLIEDLDYDGIKVYVKNGEYVNSNETSSGGKNESTGNGVLYVKTSEASCGYEDPGVTYKTAVRYMKDQKKEMYYINPTGMFSSEVVRDGNNSVTEILFVQK